MPTAKRSRAQAHLSPEPEASKIKKLDEETSRKVLKTEDPSQATLTNVHDDGSTSAHATETVSEDTSSSSQNAGQDESCVLEHRDNIIDPSDPHSILRDIAGSVQLVAGVLEPMLTLCLVQTLISTPRTFVNRPNADWVLDKHQPVGGVQDPEGHCLRDH